MDISIAAMVKSCTCQFSCIIFDVKTSLKLGQRIVQPRSYHRFSCQSGITLFELQYRSYDT